MRTLKTIICLNLILLPAIVLAGGNTTNDSFSKAKKQLLNQVYYDHRETFYCGCPYTTDKKVNMEYRYMQADMYNLVPAIGQINALRSNYSYSMIPGEPRQFGACDMEIEDRKAEPRPEIRGDIARIYFYMNDSYPGHGVISKKNRKLFEAWAKEDPVDDWERERCRRIEAIQGNHNRFVK